MTNGIIENIYTREKGIGKCQLKITYTDGIIKDIGNINLVCCSDIYNYIPNALNFIKLSVTTIN